MKQSRLFPPVLVSFIIIVLISLSHLSVAVASWDDIDYPGSGYYDSVHNLGDNPGVPTSDVHEFGTFKFLHIIDSVQLLGNLDEIHGQHSFNDIFIGDILYAIPDELLTLQINSQVSDWNNDVQSSSEPADDIVFKNNGDYVKSMRIPAPNSLLLVALGLISLRYTRSLRL